MLTLVLCLLYVVAVVALIVWGYRVGRKRETKP